MHNTCIVITTVSIETPTIVNWLEGNKFPLELALIESLRSLSTPFELEAKDYLLSEQDTWHSLFILKSGLCRMYYSDLDGNEHNKNFFLEGQCFWPILPRYQDHACGFNIQALESIQGVALPIAAVQSLFEKYQCWNIFYQRTICYILEDKLSREYSWLKLTAKERYEQLLEKHPDWVRRVPNYHLASYLGISPVSLSRLKSS